MRYLIFATLLAISSPALAFDDFKCLIKDAFELKDNGILDHQSEMMTTYIGKEFSVDRQTGIITGANLSNTMSGQMPSVQDNLPSENSFRATTVYTHTVDYLEIRQFVAEKDKPFFYKGAFGVMLSGTCVLF